MSFEAFTSMPVIVAAFAALLLGVAGTQAWRAFIEWRQAQILGFSLSDFRRMNENRIGVVARVRRRKSDLNGDWGAPQRESRFDALPPFETANRVGDAAPPGGGAYSDESAVFTTGSQQSQTVPVSPRSVPKTNKNKSIGESLATAGLASARVIVSAADQIHDFLVFEFARADCCKIKREYNAWYEAYLRWANVQSIAHMPQSTFLNLLSKAAGIQKVIARLKDPETGRVVKNDAGTPVRTYSYILGDSVAVTDKRRSETRQQKMDREIAELAERRRLAALTPDQSWPEFLASMPAKERLASGLEDLYRKIAA